jgi:hypothetical protein
MPIGEEALSSASDFLPIAHMTSACVSQKSHALFVLIVCLRQCVCLNVCTQMRLWRCLSDLHLDVCVSVYLCGVSVVCLFVCLSVLGGMYMCVSVCVCGYSCAGVGISEGVLCIGAGHLYLG